MKKLYIYLLFLLIFNMCQKENTEKINSQKPANIQKYEVIETEDMSYNDIKRIRLKIEVDHVLSEDEIEYISQEKIIKFKDNHISAAMFYFYLSGSDIKGNYNAGMAEWAPFGDWSKAGDVKSGDYTKHIIKIKTSEIIAWEDKTSIPIEKRKKIFFELAAEEDRLYNQGVKGNRTDIAINNIAEEYNITVEQVKEIRSEGLAKNWPIP